MPKYFSKTKSCGCVVSAISCGSRIVDNKILYMIGGHTHIKICQSCSEHEENGVDTLYDMWMNNNITDGSGNDGWMERM